MELNSNSLFEIVLFLCVLTEGSSKRRVTRHRSTVACRPHSPLCVSERSGISTGGKHRRRNTRGRAAGLHSVDSAIQPVVNTWTRTHSHTTDAYTIHACLSHSHIDIAIDRYSYRYEISRVTTRRTFPAMRFCGCGLERGSAPQDSYRGSESPPAEVVLF